MLVGLGYFVPVAEGGGDLYRVKEEKLYAVTGTKGFKWVEKDVAKARLDDGYSVEDIIDKAYFKALIDKAIDTINEFGSFEETFVGRN